MTGYIAIVLAFAFVMIVALSMLALAVFFGPKKITPTKLEPFECGMTQISDPRGRFSIKYYLVAIIFVMFDIEIIYIYPWAVSFKRLGIPGFLEMALFISLLLIALAYAIKKGALEWD